MADREVVCLSGCITVGPKSISAGNGRPLACAAVLRPMSINCHFQDCKSAPGHVSCKRRYRSYRPLPLFYLFPCYKRFLSTLSVLCSFLSWFLLIASYKRAEQSAMTVRWSHAH